MNKTVIRWEHLIKDGRFLVDAQADPVVAGGALVVRGNLGRHAVLGLALHRHVVDVHVHERFGTRLDARGQEIPDLVGIGAVHDFQQRPVCDVAGVDLRCGHGGLLVR